MGFISFTARNEMSKDPIDLINDSQILNHLCSTYYKFMLREFAAVNIDFIHPSFKTIKTKIRLKDQSI